MACQMDLESSFMRVDQAIGGFGKMGNSMVEVFYTSSVDSPTKATSSTARDKVRDARGIMNQCSSANGKTMR